MGNPHEYSFQDRFSKLFLKGETQEQFGKRVGINRNTVAAYCNGNRRAPDAEILRKLCMACNVSADWLLGLREGVYDLNKCCANCKWRSDDFTSVCVNDESDHLSDFVAADDVCECWEKLAEQPGE